MKSGLRALAALCSIALSVNTGCSNTPLRSGEVTQEDDSSVTRTETADAAQLTAMHTVSEKDLTPATTSQSSIAFTESGAELRGSGISANGTVVTISKAGYYSVSGKCSDGQIIIDCSKDDNVYLILNGVDLTCTTGPAILCNTADKLTLTLTGSSVNTLSDGADYTAENAENNAAAVYSHETLVINGSGTLNVNGNYKDGINSRDGLKLCGGILNVTAVEDGIIGKDYLLGASGTVTVNSGYDGLKSTNSSDAQKGYISITGGEYTLECGRDGIQAETDLNISGGTLNIVTGGGSATVEHSTNDDFGGGRWGGFSMNGGRNDNSSGNGGFDFSGMTDSEGNSAESMKGLKAGNSVSITGGTITADCADDSVHSNGSVTIGGGSFSLASGDDGIHAALLLTINDGEINISTSYEGLEANGIEINGGVISLRAYDDGINACDSDTSGTTPYLTISGGSITANADGDGVDSNGTISMSGGTLVVFGPTSNGDGALDYDVSFAMCGGTLIALGSRGMAQAPSTLSQPCLSVYSSVAADSTIEVRDADGSDVLSTVTPKACESLIFSSDKFTEGTTYSIYADDVLLTTVTATDGVSGGGATGSGAGTWNQNGSWGQQDGSRNEDFTHPNPPDGASRPERPADGDFTPPDLPQDGGFTPPGQSGSSNSDAAA